MPRALQIVLAIATLAACSGNESRPDPQAAPPPEPPPAPSEPVATDAAALGQNAGIERAPDGTTIELLDADALGKLMAEPTDKVRVYNFWATWCGPCVAELPMLRDLADERDDFELVLVNVDIRPMRRARALPFISEKDLGKFRNIGVDSRDPARVLAQVIADWNESIPVTSVHSPDGQRAKLFTRVVTNSELTAAIEAAR